MVKITKDISEQAKAKVTTHEGYWSNFKAYNTN